MEDFNIPTREQLVALTTPQKQDATSTSPLDTQRLADEQPTVSAGIHWTTSDATKAYPENYSDGGTVDPLAKKFEIFEYVTDTRFIEATDTTNHHNCTLTGQVTYVAENTAATVVGAASAIGVPATACDSSNTLTATWAQTAATPSLTQVTATLTGFTATQFQIVYSVESFGQSQTLPTF